MGNEKIYAAQVLREMIEANAKRLTDLQTGWTRRGPDKGTQALVDGLKQDNDALQTAVEALEAA